MFFFLQLFLKPMVMTGVASNWQCQIILVWPITQIYGPCSLMSIILHYELESDSPNADCGDKPAIRHLIQEAFSSPSSFCLLPFSKRSVFCCFFVAFEENTPLYNTHIAWPVSPQHCLRLHKLHTSIWSLAFYTDLISVILSSRFHYITFI